MLFYGLGARTEQNINNKKKIITSCKVIRLKSEKNSYAKISWKII